jgi:hypothetical protein
VRKFAYVTLAAIRLFMGTAGLVAPEFLARRMQIDPKVQPGIIYVFRMFGIRTILIALDLLLWGEAHRRHALRAGLVIHVSDAIAAATAGLKGLVPLRPAATATLISSFNVALALLAQSQRARHAAMSLGLGDPLAAIPWSTALTVNDLLGMSQDQLDETFRGGSSESIPHGDAEGTVLVATDTRLLAAKGLDRLIALFARQVAWSGKIVDARKGELVNKITPLEIPAIKAKVYKAPSWFDGEEAIILDYSKSSFVAKKIRDEIREVAPGLYLGQVYWGRDRIAEFALEFERPAAA